MIAVIPSYNEQDTILGAIASLRSQTRRADEIIVLANDCTDDTAFIALAAGVSVVEAVGIGDGKAGALNVLFADLLPILDDDDCVLVMDADTELTERFIESTVTTLFGPSKKPIAGVGGIFLANDAPWNLVQQLQTNEYVRYRRRLSRRHGRALVLTGTGTAFKVGFLREVQQARRDYRLPDLGHTGGVYDTSALTEDNELTICAKELGYRVVSPKDCTVKTAMMPTLASLFKQRRRWQRGALENLIAHGLNRHTAPYAIRQALTYLGVLFLPFYLWTLTVALITQSSL
ncbi:MAG: glycosyltransferase family 2 protein, partial [Mycobacterium sp.]